MTAYLASALLAIAAFTAGALLLRWWNRRR